MGDRRRQTAAARIPLQALSGRVGQVGTGEIVECFARARADKRILPSHVSPASQSSEPIRGPAFAAFFARNRPLIGGKTRTVAKINLGMHYSGREQRADLRMNETPEPELDPIRKRLFEAKLGELARWRIPSISPSVGPFEPEAFKPFNKRRLEIVDAVRERLQTYSQHELIAIAEHRGREMPEVVQFWRSFLDEPIYRLKKKIPPWYAGGFGHPDYRADFDYWCKMPNFSIEEALCLSIGIEPRHFTKDVISKSKNQDFDALWSPIQFLLLRHMQLHRQFDPDSFGYRITPLRFLSWARQVKFEAHPDFFGLLEQYHPSSTSQSTSPASEPRSDPREVKKMAQLFTALAIREYGYVPDAARSPIPKEIAEMMAELGLSVSEETVRKYLRLGAQHLPKDWKPNTD